MMMMMVVVGGASLTPVMMVMVMMLFVPHQASALSIQTAQGSVSVALGEVLDATTRGPQHTVITLGDHTTLAATVLKGEWLDGRSAGVFVVPEWDNLTLSHLQPLLAVAKQLRLSSWWVTLVVVSEDSDFLSRVGEWAKAGRLMVWATRLLLVTRLTRTHVHSLLTHSWTFAMMNTMILNDEHEDGLVRCGVYSHLPYSERGAVVMRVASWTPEGITLLSHLTLFPEKYTDFFGSPVNVTALPFPPYWNVKEVMVEGGPDDGTPTKQYTGTDYFMLEAISQALNFSINVMPTANWGEVTKRVEERTSFIATVIYAVFPQRLENYDYTYMFEYAFHAFCMAKPALRPQWQSLYYPLQDQVWASVLAVLLFIPLPLMLVMEIEAKGRRHPKSEKGFLLLWVFGILLGQDLPLSTSRGPSNRLLLSSWLVFAFILGVAYRGNLTASLTAPKYPTRVESLAQLVRSGAIVTMPPYGAQFRDFFKQSESGDFQTLGERVKIVSTAIEGIDQSSTRRQAHMEARRYLELVIAEKFTLRDGSTQLYVARESVFPGLSAWPIPHDAPYKPTLDRTIMAVKEGGLYEKWSSDMLNEARRESRVKQREDQQKEGEGEGTGTIVGALTVVHMQGPLLLLVLGLLFAGLAFLCEALVERCCRQVKSNSPSGHLNSLT